MVGGEVNRRLAPGPRSVPTRPPINACKIGGIAANNASGMCCGTAQNSYRTLAGMRVVLADGTVLDTEDPFSIAAFRQNHAALVGELDRLGRRPGDNALAPHPPQVQDQEHHRLQPERLVDYEDPIDILAHLMIGSEGTWASFPRITYRTVAEDPSARPAPWFSSPPSAPPAKAVIALKPQPVSAVELLDRPALRSVENKPGLPPVMKTWATRRPRC